MAERVVIFIFFMASTVMVTLGAASLGGIPAAVLALGACFFFFCLMLMHADMRGDT